MKHLLFLCGFSALVPCIVRALDERTNPTTFKIITALYHEHQTAHKDMPKASTTWYAGATVVPSVNIIARMPTDANGPVDLTFTPYANHGKRGELYGLLTGIEHEQRDLMSNQDEQPEPRLCDEIAAYVATCLRMSTYQRQRELADKVVPLDSYTRIILPGAITGLVKFKTAVPKNILDGFSRNSNQNDDNDDSASEGSTQDSQKSTLSTADAADLPAMLEREMDELAAHDDDNDDSASEGSTQDSQESTLSTADAQDKRDPLDGFYIIFTDRGDES